MAPRETENNGYANFGVTKSITVFSGEGNCVYLHIKPIKCSHCFENQEFKN